MELQVQHHPMEYSTIQDHSQFRHLRLPDNFGAQVFSSYLKPML